MKVIHIILPLTIGIGIYCLLPKFSSVKEDQTKAKVYFTKTISPQAMVEMYKKLGVNLSGNIALKVHSGETLGKYFLTPDFLQSLYDHIKTGTYVECNTAYKNHRHTTELHELLAKEHGWNQKERKFVIMDADKEKDWNLTVKHEGGVLTHNIVGEHLKDFDSCLVLSHFKGHGSGGFGGALKQLSIGFASQAGKSHIHSGGQTADMNQMRNFRADQITFTTAMAEAASTIVDYFKKREKGGMAYISVVANISISCDCAGGNAKEPQIKDIGILASDDPVAIDQAGLDLIKKSPEGKGKEDWLNQVKNKEGENTIKVAQEIGFGTTKYDLIEVKLAGKYLFMSFWVLLIWLFLF